MANKRGLINNAWLVRVLAQSENTHRCTECGARMFVRAASGLCPMCFTRQRLREEQIEAIVEAEADCVLPDWVQAGSDPDGPSPQEC